MVKIIPYNPKLVPLARKLRKNMTPGEILLWKELKGDKLLGFDFDRQCCIDNYIVDFFCKELRLAIEIDGLYHHSEEVVEADQNRQIRLESLGVYVIRFSETEVKCDMINVLRTLKTKIVWVIQNRDEISLPDDFDISLLDD